jgi:tRNA-uridine 2-sulfurtransferase
MRVLTAMSGGVDSSVTAALLLESGHDVVGATMKLWGGPSDSGCCSVADVEDARRVAQQLGIVHHVFNFTDDFDRHVVDPYVADHVRGRTPNPCVACNRHLKFDRFLERAAALGFDAVATGHHARVDRRGGRYRLLRGVDQAKDQSYVLHMLDQRSLPRVLLPIGELTKRDVRARAAALALRTAAKPDSQDVCFISRTGGRQPFLQERVPLHRGRVVDASGREIGTADAVELVTVGQRRGLGVDQPKGQRLFALDVDTGTATVTVGGLADLLVEAIAVEDWSWVRGCPPPDGAEVEVQTSAHGRPGPAVLVADGGLRLLEPRRKVAPGQSVVVYRGDEVLGGGRAAWAGRPPAA